MVTVWRRMWRWLAATFAAVVIVMALAIGGFRLFLSQTPEYAGEIESWVSENLGLDVVIGTIDARWSFAGPEIFFENTELRQDGRLVVRAKRGRVAVRLTPLLQGQIRPNRVILEDTRVDIVRNDAGGLAVAGQSILEPKQNSGDWDLSGAIPEGVFELRQATINYTDERRGESYAFKNVSLRLANESDLIVLRGDIGLPEPLGDSIRFSVDTNDKLRDQKRWRLYLEADNFDLGSWMLIGQWNQLGIVSGKANVKLHGAFVGDRLELANAKLDIRALELADPQGNLVYDAIKAELDWDRQTQGWNVSAKNFQIQTKDRVWDPVSMSFELTTSDQPQTQIIYADAEYLNFDDLFPLIKRAPLDAGIKADLEAYSPRGEIRNVLFNASRRDGVLTSYSLRTEFDGLGVNAKGKLPGIKNLSGALRMDTSGGSLELASSDVEVHMPKTFRWPLTMDNVRGGISWRQDSAGTTVQSKDLSVSNADAKTSTTFRLVMPATDKIPTLELRSDVRDALVGKAKPYLPKSKIKPKVLAWLDQALVGGRVPEGVVTYDGPIKGFPFDDGQGDFKAAFSVQNLQLNYAKSWPDLEQATADIVFHNAKLTADIVRGNVAANPITRSRVEIRDLRQGVVDIDGHSETLLPDLLNFVRASPIGTAFGTQLEDMRMVGRGNAEFNIVFPAKDRTKTTVQGFVDLDATELRLEGIDHKLINLRGRLGFSQNALRANKLEAQLLGSPVSIDIVPAITNEGLVDATLMIANGVIDNVGLETYADVPVGLFLGQTDWRGIIRFPRSREGGPKDIGNIIVETNLSGMQVNLPQPFGVAADETRPLTLEFRFAESGEIDTEFGLGDDVRMVGNLRESETRSWSFARANLNFGPDLPALTSTDRLVISGHVSMLDLDDWLALGIGSAAESPALHSVIRSLNVQADRFFAFGQEFSDVGIKLDHNIREWLVQLSGDAIDGSIFVPLAPDRAEPIIMDLTRLHLAEADTDEAEPDQAPSSDPRGLPSLHLKIGDFSYGEMNFGGLEAQIQKEADGLRLVTMRTTAPSFSTDGTGHWLLGADGHRSQLDLKLTSTDVASTMIDLGYGDTLSADSGELSLNLNWAAAPDKDFLHNISGTGSVGVSKGQLTSVKPKAGRVFGLLSVAALPRRLSLDFRDVFDKGLGFDSISGDFSFEKGNAYTSNLTLEGPAADVVIEGRTGLIDKDYDQTAVVQADIGNTLPIAGALLAGPGAGAALLVFSQIFKQPLKQITAVEYRITGSWDEPDIEQLSVSGRQGNSG